MAQYHHQWTRNQYSGRLGAPMKTNLFLKNTGEWIGTRWKLTSHATIEDREYQYSEETMKEPNELVYRQHRARAAANIREKVREVERG